jgi:hypothetical protein
MLHHSRQPPEDARTALARVGLLSDRGTGRPHSIKTQGGSSILLAASPKLGAAGGAVLGRRRAVPWVAKERIDLSTAYLQALETQTSEVIGTQVVAAGLRVGPGGRSKLAIALVDRSCQPKAIAKFPLTDLAKDSLAREVEAITSLHRIEGLSSHLPELLAQPELGGHRGILVAAGPRERVRSVGREVISFLHDLHELTTASTGLNVGTVSTSWLDLLEHRRDFLSRGQASILDSAISYVADSLAEARLPNTTAHGDFTRWNLRVGNQGLFVFDWEASFDQALPYHDLFHFFAAESALRRRPSPTTGWTWRRISSLAAMIAPDEVPLLGPLYVGYLVHTILWYLHSGTWRADDRPGPFWQFLWAELAPTSRRFRVTNRQPLL